MSYTNKVRVTSQAGAGALGMMDPKAGMQTDRGEIIALGSGNFQVTVSGAGLGPLRRYPHELLVTLAEATGSHAWPTGDGSVVFGYAGDFPGGVPKAVNNKMAYTLGKSGTFTFER